MARIHLLLAIAVVVLIPAGCKAPPVPPEVELVRQQEIEVRKSGAEHLAPPMFSSYIERLGKARAAFLKEENRLAPMRDYKEVASELAGVLADGAATLSEVERIKQETAARLNERLASVESSIGDIDSIMTAAGEHRTSGKYLLKASLAVTQARSMLGREEYASASARIDDAEKLVRAASSALRSTLGRYTDGGQLKKWRTLVSSAINKSKATGGKAIVVNKIERSLLLYEGGKLVKSYRIGLGRNGSNDKMRAGDNATPEGSYRITKKIPASAYHKALLINYPNDEDRRRFAKAKRSGAIPSNASIGGLVEIHGGGGTSVTRGCISLDNDDMDELYSRVSVGTTVVIVGATELDKALASVVGGAE